MSIPSHFKRDLKTYMVLCMHFFLPVTVVNILCLTQPRKAYLCSNHLHVCFAFDSQNNAGSGICIISLALKGRKRLREVKSIITRQSN